MTLLFLLELLLLISHGTVSRFSFNEPLHLLLLHIIIIIIIIIIIYDYFSMVFIHIFA